MSCGVAEECSCGHFFRQHDGRGCTVGCGTGWPCKCKCTHSVQATKPKLTGFTPNELEVLHEALTDYIRSKTANQPYDRASVFGQMFHRRLDAARDLLAQLDTLKKE